MVMKKLSKPGLLLSSIFALIFFICLYWVYIGHWQSIFLIWIVTFPFSLVCHALAGWLQSSLSISHEVRSWVEAGLLGLMGLSEFYFLGLLLERSWKKR